MTPIERVAERSKALSLLGLSGSPTKAEIRNSFRRIAFEKHPDHGAASSDEFARISTAYQLLYSNAVEDRQPAPQRDVRVSRPDISAIETEFSETVREECRAAVRGTGSDNASPLVPTRLYRKGRTLTYFVPLEQNADASRVSLPSGDLVDGRSVRPQVLTIRPIDLAGPVYEVPKHVREDLFPGARSVQIHFGHPAST